MSSALLRRVEREVRELILPEYGTFEGRVTYDTGEGKWLCVKHMPVPKDLMTNRDGQVSLLLLIPEQYPQVPPDGFYCDQGLNIQNHYFVGFRDKYYPELQQTLIQQGWQWFCAHASHFRSTSNWRASATPGEGDNLLKYLRLSLAILGSEAQKIRRQPPGESAVPPSPQEKAAPLIDAETAAFFDEV